MSDLARSRNEVEERCLLLCSWRQAWAAPLGWGVARARVVRRIRIPLYDLDHHTGFYLQFSEFFTGFAYVGFMVEPETYDAGIIDKLDNSWRRVYGLKTKSRNDEMIWYRTFVKRNLELNLPDFDGSRFSATVILKGNFIRS